jgi:hypothetical protein
VQYVQRVGMGGIISLCKNYSFFHDPK